MDAADKTDLNEEKMENGPMSVTNRALRTFEDQAVIKVCGIGGGGGNAVDRMIHEGLQEAEFITINTDAQALKKSPASVRLQIGADITGGLGSGADPEIGRQSALEDKDRIAEVLKGADMVFLTAGLGGGTGTGAAPIIAELARESGALTVAIVTLPFYFEGPKRKNNAYAGLAALEEHVDTLIVVPNDRVIQFSPEDMSVAEAFRQADEVLHNGVQSITELIRLPGNINADFADVRTIMRARGRALIGIGVAKRDETEASTDGATVDSGQSRGPDRAIVAAKEAIICPLLEQSDITGAMEVLVNIIGGKDMGIHEVDKAVSTVRNAAHPRANVIWGAVVGEEERPELRVTVIAAGFVEPEEVPVQEEDSETAAPPSPAAPEPAPSTEAEKTETPQEPPIPVDDVPDDEEPKQPERAAASAEGDSSSSTQPERVAAHAEAGTSSSTQAEEKEPEVDTSIPAYLRRRQNQAPKEVAVPPSERGRTQEAAEQQRTRERRQEEAAEHSQDRSQQREPKASSPAPPQQQEIVEHPPTRGRGEEPVEHSRTEASNEEAAETAGREPKTGRKPKRKMPGFMANRGKPQQDEA